MAIIETTRRGGSTEQTSSNVGATQTLVDRKRRTFRASGYDTDQDAMDAVIGTYGDIDTTHPDNSDLLLRRVSSEAVDGSNDVFEVGYEYEFRGVPGALPPTSEPPNIVWSSQTIEEPTYFDANDVQIKNTAGEPFDDAITRPYAIVVLQYSFNAPVFPANLIFTHVERVNAGQWSTQTTGAVPDKCALLKGISAPLQWQGDTKYYRITYDIAFRSQIVKGTEYGWKLVALNVGYSYLKSGKLENIYKAGVLTRMPVLLSADGTRYEGDNGGAGGVDPANPVYIIRDIRKSADFSVLGVQ